MEFVRSIARTVTVLHEGSVLAEGPMDAGAGRPAGDRGLPRDVSADADAARADADDKLNQFYGGSHILWDLDLEVPAGEVRLPAGPQRRRQDDAAQDASWACCRRRSGTITFDGADLTRATPHERARARHRLRAAGPRDLPAADGRGEPADRALGARPAARDDPGRRSSSCSRCSKKMLQPPRRRPVGRPAAAARDRPRAGARTRSC